MATIEELASQINRENPKLDGWCTEEKALRLARAVLDTKAGLTVELGVFGGRGVIAMALAHKHAGNGVAWGFDPWKKEAALEGDNGKENDAWWEKLDLEAIYRVFVEKVHSFSLLPWLFWGRLKSEQAVLLFRDETIDVLHCDANHSEITSCRDVTAWAPKIKRGGLWFMDDTDWTSTTKAQGLLLQKGFVLIEDHKKWAIYKKQG